MLLIRYWIILLKKYFNFFFPFHEILISSIVMAKAGYSGGHFKDPRMLCRTTIELGTSFKFDVKWGRMTKIDEKRRQISSFDECRMTTNDVCHVFSTSNDVIWHDASFMTNFDENRRFRRIMTWPDDLWRFLTFWIFQKKKSTIFDEKWWKMTFNQN